MLKIVIVKTWSENKQEGKDYLKYNGYGKIIKNIPCTDLYICIGYKKFNLLKDVKIVNVF